MGSFAMDQEAPAARRHHRVNIVPEEAGDGYRAFASLAFGFPTEAWLHARFLVICPG
jgi:hypothetical protein